jgi:hypothetical protein
MFRCLCVLLFSQCVSSIYHNIVRVLAQIISKVGVALTTLTPGSTVQVYSSWWLCIFIILISKAMEIHVYSMDFNAKCMGIWLSLFSSFDPSKIMRSCFKLVKAYTICKILEAWRKIPSGGVADRGAKGVTSVRWVQTLGERTPLNPLYRIQSVSAGWWTVRDFNRYSNRNHGRYRYSINRY